MSCRQSTYQKKFKSITWHAITISHDLIFINTVVVILRLNWELCRTAEQLECNNAAIVFNGKIKRDQWNMCNSNIFYSFDPFVHCSPSIIIILACGNPICNCPHLIWTFSRISSGDEGSLHHRIRPLGGAYCIARGDIARKNHRRASHKPEYDA